MQQDDITSLISRSVDVVPVRDGTREMIDFDLVQRHVEMAIARGRYNGPADALDYLYQRRCLIDRDGIILPTLAGLICFGHTPQTLFPSAVVDIAQYSGVKPVSFEMITLRKNIGGTIFTQLEETMRFISERMQRRSTLDFSDNIERVEIGEYPLPVLRELCLNMLCHRDYVDEHASSRVMLFRDRLEWISPGGLQPGVTVETILEAQKSRNPVIMMICYEAGLVEGFGQGLDTVVEVLLREEMSPPHFIDVGHSFIVTVKGRDLENLSVFNTASVRQQMLNFISRRSRTTFSDLMVSFSDRSRRSLQRDIADLIASGQIQQHGATRSVYYTIARADSQENDLTAD